MHITTDDLRDVEPLREATSYTTNISAENRELFLAAENDREISQLFVKTEINVETWNVQRFEYLRKQFFE